ncbi:DUF2795 domain-containing protein [Actinomadura violacea]|uniref:DUF2795 domain-containing protein n=1 Tax=Actinomadura violacea TaxID=2819934 RepID=A0ABS3S3Q8_9ACTN|nr:DUF2795 domain-containing protein [Actinomadura violacea]MBO2463631.1 DUF2795 domain-containing protein [Actinomadura violacea]
MPDKSDKHGPKVDDEIGHETEGMVRGGHPTHAEEFKETEPYSGDAPWDPTAATGDPREGSPPGMSAGDVEGRSNLARLLSGVRYPARPGDLVAHASGAGADDAAVGALETLPDREYENVADVADELGYGRENRRF